MRKKTYSLASKFVAALTAVGLAGLGCATEQDSAPEDDPGAREVALEVWTNLPDDTGKRKMLEMGSTTATLNDLLSGDRALLVDGVETHDLAGVRSGEEIVVPLNTGETATLVRKGDLLELASFTGEDDGASELPRGAVKAVRMQPDGIDVFLSGSEGSEADTIMRVSRIEDLEAERSALVTSLALDSLLVSLEDGEQLLPPAVAIAIVAAIVGVAWMAACGGFAWWCAEQCQWGNGFETQCADVTVSVNPPSFHIGGGLSCICH